MTNCFAEGQYLVKARLFLHVIYSSFLFFVPLLLQPTPDTVFCRMWWPGEDGQEARSLQKLPEAGVRSVAQEQVFGYLHDWRMNITCLHATVGIQGRFHYHPSRIVRCLENDANNVYKRWMQVTFQTWKSWIISSGQQGQFLCVIIKEFVLSALISLQH